MDQQILQAVEIALSGNADPQLKQQAFEFVEQIKSTAEGYRSCVDILSKQGHDLNDQFKFFIFQVIEENVGRIGAADELYQLTETLFKFVREDIERQDSTTSSTLPPAFVKNKLAGLLATVFCHVYLEIRPQFLKELWALVEKLGSQSAADYYLRTLLAIHLEIGDKFISRSREGQDRNVLLKDKIRVEDMGSLVQSWKGILERGGVTNTTNKSLTNDILNHTLRVIGQYIEWMEISLFVDHPFINTIFQYLSKSDQRTETCSTLIEIISKKMKPSNKLELISLLNLTNVINSVTSSDDQANNDLEFSENVAKLLNQVGLELLIVLESEAKSLTANTDIAANANAQILALWPFIFSFLSHEYDDVSQQVFPFISQYLLACKRFPGLVQVELLSTLLNKIILKMKWDDDADGLVDSDDFDDDHEQFMDIRLKLKVFQDTIAVLNPELYLERVPLVINDSLFNNNGSPAWQTLELGLLELSIFADSLRNNLINVPKNQIASSDAYRVFQSFLVKLINSDFIISFDHPMIQSGFFELVVRHYSFLSNYKGEGDKSNNGGSTEQSNSSNAHTPSQLTLRILEIFSSPLGLFNLVEKVRLRCWYLFFRFAKLTRPTLTNHGFLEQLLTKVQPLLAIKAVLPAKDEDDDVVEGGNFNNQMNLFEAIGLIVSLSVADTSSKATMVDMVFEPLFRDLERCVGANNTTVDPVQLQLIQLQAHHSLMAIGTFARGYDCEPSSVKYQPEVIAKINNAAQVVLITLETFAKLELIRDSSRFAFARFIPILGSALTNHLSKLVSLILGAPLLKYSELTDFLGFIGQIVHNFQKDDTIYQLLNDLVLPLFDKTFALLKYNGENNEFDAIPDMVRDKNSLKKAYMNLLSTIILNHQASLFITETNKPKFPVVVESLFENAYDLTDPTVSRLAVIQLVNFVLVFGGAGGKISDPLDKMGVALPAVEGVDSYLMNKLVQLSFELPFQRQEFDIKDAQFRIIAQEIATLLKTYHKTKGDEFLGFLSTYLTNMGLSQDHMNGFGTALVKLDQREFKKFFIEFITELKGK